MNNTAKKRLAIELGKDLLILLLCCTAVLLAMRGQLFASAPRLFGGQDSRQTGTAEPAVGVQADAACPLRLAVNLTGANGETARLGLQDDAACQALFQQLAAPLAEALSAADAPEQISRQQWEQALSAAEELERSGISTRVVKLNRIAPLDTAAILRETEGAETVLILEDCF